MCDGLGLGFGVGMVMVTEMVMEVGGWEECESKGGRGGLGVCGEVGGREGGAMWIVWLNLLANINPAYDRYIPAPSLPLPSQRPIQPKTFERPHTRTPSRSSKGYENPERKEREGKKAAKTQVGVGEGQLEHTANSPLPLVSEHTSYGTCASPHTYWQQWSYGVGHPAVLSKRPVHVEVGKGNPVVMVVLLSVVLVGEAVVVVVLGGEAVVFGRAAVGV